MLSAGSPHRSSEPQRLPLHPLAWPQLTCSIPSTPPCGCFSLPFTPSPFPAIISDCLQRCTLHLRTEGRRGKRGVWAGGTRPVCKARPWGAPPAGRVGRMGFQLSCALCPRQPVVVVPPRGGGSCFPSGALLALEQRGSWRAGACGVEQTLPGPPAGACFLPSPCPEAAGPSSGLTPLRTRTSLLPHGCRLHPVL